MDMHVSLAYAANSHLDDDIILSADRIGDFLDRETLRFVVD